MYLSILVDTMSRIATDALRCPVIPLLPRCTHVAPSNPKDVTGHPRYYTYFFLDSHQQALFENKMFWLPNRVLQEQGTDILLYSSRSVWFSNNHAV